MGIQGNQTIILIEHEDGRREIWGSLSEICREHGYVYNTLTRKKWPFSHDGWTFLKIPFREKAGTFKAA